MNIPADVLEDIRWVHTELIRRGIKENDIISVLDGILKRGQNVIKSNPAPAHANALPNVMPPRSWEAFNTERALFDDAVVELVFAEDYSENFIRGDEVPVKTPLKKKRAKMDTTELDSDASLNTAGDDDIFIKPDDPAVTVQASVPEPSGNITQNELEKSKQQLKERYSTCKVVQLKELCQKEKLSKIGRKQELVDRLVDQGLKNQYGSPRMRNSYQTAMASPLPHSEERPVSALSQASLKSESSSTSIKSEAGRTSKRTMPKSTKQTAPSSNRFRSPSPNQGPPSLPRTPSFRAKLTNRLQNSPFQSPRLWNKTPSGTSLSLKNKTPSKADLQAKDAENAKRIEDQKKARNVEIERKRQEKLKKAEDVRRKKEALEARQKIKVKTPNLKAQKQKIQAERKAREEEKQRAELERKNHEKALRDEAKRERQKSNFMEYTPGKDSSRMVSNYEMTPHGQDKWDANPSSKENYNIDDLSSGDETDDGDHPRKSIPAWAQRAALHSALKRQYKNIRYGTVDQMYVTVTPDRSVELKALFDHLADTTAKRRYRQPRRSSGSWTTMVNPPALVDRTLNLEQSVFPIQDEELSSIIVD